jgi:hypothetical protein
MGAEFDFLTYRTFDKSEIRKAWAEAVDGSLRESGSSYSGCIGMLGGEIQWHPRKLSTQEEAVQYVMEHHDKWEPPVAVQFADGWVVGGWCSS